MKLNQLSTILLISFLLTSNEMSLRRLDSNDDISENASATKVFKSTETLSTSTSASSKDTSIIRVSSSNGNLTINGGEYTKTGDTTDKDNSDFYGVNAGILVTKGATCSITGTSTSSIKISSNATGGNAIMATGTGATATLDYVEITTSGTSSSRGCHATYGGTITAKNTKITTTGGSCASLATDRGQGTVSCENCELNTGGAGSPLIYSTGSITVKSTTGKATGAQITVVEGKNSATIESSSTLEAVGTGNKDSGDDACGVMVYQSQSGDADSGEGTFTCTSSTLKLTTSTYPFFFVTNTIADINLKGCTLDYGNGTLIKIGGTSGNDWGTAGSNGGIVTLTIDGMEVKGNVVVDSISNITLILKNSAKLTGAIDEENQAAGISISIDSTSSLVLTGNSRYSSIEDGSLSQVTLGSYTFTKFDNKTISISSGGGDNGQGGNNGQGGDNGQGGNNGQGGDNGQGGNNGQGDQTDQDDNSSSIKLSVRFLSAILVSLFLF